MHRSMVHTMGPPCLPGPSYLAPFSVGFSIPVSFTCSLNPVLHTRSTVHLDPHTCLYPLQEAALRAYYINEDPRDFQLQALPLTTLSGNAQTLGKAGTTEEEASKSPGPRDSMPEAWVIRSLPRAQEILKIYPAWLK